MTTPPSTTYSVISYDASQLPESYQALVYSKWLHSLRFDNDYFKLMDKHPYYTIYHKFLEQLLAKPDCKVRLAVLTDDHDVVLGFSVSRGTILDYVHVHKDMRKQGIGTALVPQGIETITHLTNIGLSIWASKMNNTRFNPFI